LNRCYFNASFCDVSLTAGMQTNAEILLGTRSVLEYLLSPVKKAWHEAGQKR
jgi:HlyD family secretion protein